MRWMRVLLSMSLAAGLLAGCEDGPAQVFQPVKGDSTDRNGNTADQPFTQPEATQPISVPECVPEELGEARFCCENEHEDVVQRLVQLPIVPDQSLGGVPLWSAEGPPTFADSLLGRPEDGKLCDPTVYANALTWGPTNEIIAFINQETHLIEMIIATEQYLGTLEGTFPGINRDTGEEEDIPVFIALRERLRIGEREFDQYVAAEDQEGATNAWLNHTNVTDLYRFIRINYYGDPPGDFPEGYDCVLDNVCSVIYTGQASGPQVTVIYFNASGFYVAFSPEGHIVEVGIEPVLAAPFSGSQMTLGSGGGGEEIGAVAPTMTSEACTLELARGITFGQLKRDCLGADADRALKRFVYGTYGQRDAVSVDFNGLSLAFQRKTSEKGVFRDGEKPGDDDVLFEIGVSRFLNAPVAEFKPRTLARKFKAKLEQRIREHVHVAAIGAGGDDGGVGVDGGGPPPDEADAGVAPPDLDGGDDPVELDAGEVQPIPDAGPVGPPVADHPFLAWDLTIPAEIPDESAPMDVLTFNGPTGPSSNWIEAVTKQINDLYLSLTPEQRAQIDPIIIEPTWIIEPFVDAVLEEFSHNRVNQENGWKGFDNPDDKQWVIGFGHFIQDGVPFRMIVQYGLNYGAITALNVSYGYGEVDDLMHQWNQAVRPRPGGLGGGEKSPYYGIDLSRMDPNENPYALGGTGIRMSEGIYDWDRELGTVTVEVTVVEDGRRTLREMVLPGSPIEDANGYLRQIRGERYEFVPATQVVLGGREAGLTFYVEADGRIGRVSQGRFKHPVNLCPGLTLRFGDNVREKIEAWEQAVGLQNYRACELVFNYSVNGNVLDGVVSLANRVTFGISAGRATSVAMWR